MIRKQGEHKYVLYTADGKQKLGTHTTKTAAERQERAVQASKHRKGK